MTGVIEQRHLSDGAIILEKALEFTASAQSNLGRMYGNGEGVLQDNVYAHMWFNIASSNGSETARENRDIAAKRMTPNQLAEAQSLARECVKKDYKNC